MVGVAGPAGMPTTERDVGGKPPALSRVDKSMDGKRMTNELWGEVQDALLNAMGEHNYKTWIRPLEFTDCEDGVARFDVPTTFIGNWVNRNYSDQILQQLHSAGVAVRRIEFNTRTHGQARPAPAPAPVGGEPVEGEADDAPACATDPLGGGALDARFTFDTFVVGPPNELAHAAARRVAEGGPVTFNPLFLFGGVGLG